MPLAHLDVRSSIQGRDIGSAMLRRLITRADVLGFSIRVGPLRESASNRFCLRHGYIQMDECDWDIYYVRQPRSA